MTCDVIIAWVSFRFFLLTKALSTLDQPQGPPFPRGWIGQCSLQREIEAAGQPLRGKSPGRCRFLCPFQRWFIHSVHLYKSKFFTLQVSLRDGLGGLIWPLGSPHLPSARLLPFKLLVHFSVRRARQLAMESTSGHGITHECPWSPFQQSSAFPWPWSLGRRWSHWSQSQSNFRQFIQVVFAESRNHSALLPKKNTLSTLPAAFRKFATLDPRAVVTVWLTDADGHIEIIYGLYVHSRNINRSI